MFREFLKPALEQWELSLTELQAEQLEAYAQAVLDYGKKTNLTSAKNKSQILRPHLLDGLACLPVLKSIFAGRAEFRLADVGAGAGFVGITLKISQPQMHLTLVESACRKFQFLSNVVAELKLPGCRVLWKRAEDLRPPDADFDAVVERALSPLPRAMDTCAPLLRPEGFFLAYQSKLTLEAIPELQRHGKLLELKEIKNYAFPGGGTSRQLLVFQKRI